MRLRRYLVILLLLLHLASLGLARSQSPATLAESESLTWEDDLSARMVRAIDSYLLQALDQSVKERQKLWRRDFSSLANYEDSIGTNRTRLQKCIGASDPRVANQRLELAGVSPGTPPMARTDGYSVYPIRWPVFPGAHGEGLLLRPHGAPVARVVVIPDADQTPEEFAGLLPDTRSAPPLASQLADSGCEVIVLTLIDRGDAWSGNPQLGRFTNLPHREWIYRQAFEMGRHIIGYEVQKVRAAIDWFVEQNEADTTRKIPAVQLGVVGYGEGGLIALHTAALDTRVDAALVSGYFGARERIWEEPIYRNVFGLLREFGDAEIASLVAPRSLIIEYSEAPKISGPPVPRAGRGGAAPGRLSTPGSHRVEQEVQRARLMFPNHFKFPLQYFQGEEGTTIGPGSPQALAALLSSLGVSRPLATNPRTVTPDLRPDLNPLERQRRQVGELTDHLQRMLRVSDAAREEFFWRQVQPGQSNRWEQSCAPYRRILSEEVIGRLPEADVPANPRTRKIRETGNWTAYDVVLDVVPDVFAWGILILPKDLRPGERRPVVVCQHGLEGVPIDTINGPGESGYPYYKSFAAKLAEQGFVTFAPHNPYRGEDRFRELQRKANPLGLSLFSFIVAQHDRILDWLSAQPYVDSKRIAFYGLSYGGKTAMRIPALLDRYCLSICSADFNDWIRKNVTTDSPYSYLFTGEYELPEFNLGHTFNYAEMAALIAPRPFMVERGHDDGVAPDEWVAYEYAKVQRLYAKLGIPDRTEIEFFNGPHTINGVGTFSFLHRHLGWPVTNPIPEDPSRH